MIPAHFLIQINNFIPSVILLVLSYISVILFFKNNIKFVKIDLKVNLINLLISLPVLILSIFSLILIFKTNSEYWDHFTFWWDAPKKLFLYGKLPIIDSNGIQNANYSYISIIPYFLTYQTLGAIKEQFLPIYNNLYFLTSIYFIFYIQKKNILKITSIFYIIYFYTFALDFLIYSYADLYSSMLILSIIYFTFRNKSVPIFEIIFLIINFVLLKSTNKYYLYGILPLILLYFFQNFKSIKIKITKNTILYIFLISLLILSYIYYKQSFNNLNFGIIELTQSNIKLDNLIDNFKTTVIFLIFAFKYYLIFLLLILYMCIFKRNYRYILTTSLILPLINILYYVLCKSHAPYSLLRYISIVSFLPLISLKRIQFSSKIFKNCFLIVNFILIFFILKNHILKYKTHLSKKYNNGYFVKEDYKQIKNYLSLTDKILTISKPLSFHKEKELFLSNHISNLIKYYLTDYTFDQNLLYIKYSQIIEYINKNKINILILTDYDEKLLLFINKNFKSDKTKLIIFKNTEILVLRLR